MYLRTRILEVGDHHSTVLFQWYWYSWIPEVHRRDPGRKLVQTGLVVGPAGKLDTHNDGRGLRIICVDYCMPPYIILSKTALTYVEYASYEDGGEDRRSKEK